jgi:hypothetical protein
MVLFYSIIILFLFFIITISSEVNVRDITRSGWENYRFGINHVDGFSAQTTHINADCGRIFWDTVRGCH